jgi:undecaprenyl diphosphate synthase
VALNFSGRDDIVNAARAIAVKVQTGSLIVDDINASTFSNNLSMVHIDEQYRSPDFLIRTGGEQRISNFLLWQLAYSELYFSDVYWPDFDRKHLIHSIREYSNRDRRFGARF